MEVLERIANHEFACELREIVETNSPIATVEMADMEVQANN